jgi:hypothetical protein
MQLKSAPCTILISQVGAFCLGYNIVVTGKVTNV